MKKKKKNINKIIDIKDLPKSLGLEIINDTNNIQNEDNNNIDENSEQKNNKNIEIKVLEEILKRKEDYEIKFTELKDKCNQYNKVKEELKIVINNHKDYLDDINQNMNIYFMEFNNSENVVNEEKSKSFDNIYKQTDNISYLISKIEQINFDITRLFGINIENLLTDIHQNLKNIDNKKYNDEEDLKNMIEKIKHRIEEIENICFIFEENKNNFYEENKNIEKQINILSEELILLDEQKDIDNNECINNNNIKTNNINIPNNTSFLLITKNISGKYDSKNIFKEEEDLIENNSETFKLLPTNWNEKCYIYDDYEIHDINCDIKVFGLHQNKCSSFILKVDGHNSIIEVQKLFVNEKESEYIVKNNHSIELKVNLVLDDLQSPRIHLIYKKSKDLTKLSLAQKEYRKYVRKEKYGLNKSLAGQKAKFSLILKGNFDVISFDNYFLVRNKKNLNEIEYRWVG